MKLNLKDAISDQFYHCSPLITTDLVWSETKESSPLRWLGVYVINTNNSTALVYIHFHLVLQTDSLINSGSYGLISLIATLRKQWARLEVLIGPQSAINIYPSEQEWIPCFCRLHTLSSWCGSLSIKGGEVAVALASIALTLSQSHWLQITY